MSIPRILMSRPFHSNSITHCVCKPSSGVAVNRLAQILDVARQTELFVRAQRRMASIATGAKVTPSVVSGKRDCRTGWHSSIDGACT